MVVLKSSNLHILEIYFKLLINKLPMLKENFLLVTEMQL
jgi:hypothetical protein